MKTKQTCLHCGQTFEPTRSDAKFCNTRCRRDAWKSKSAETKVKVHPAALRLLTDATWEFAHSILWDGYPFSKAEVELSKLFIREYYEEIPAEEFTQTAHRHFTAYCERVLLAKEYVSRFAHRYIPHPIIWLNKENPKGFTGTKAWYLRNLEKRRHAWLCENCIDNINPIHKHFHFCA